MSLTWRDHPVTQLTLTRLREFLREPEAVFWTYGFPLVMIIALGYAFRSEPQESIAVMVQDGPRSPELVRVLQTSPILTVTSGPPEACRAQLRSGKSELIVVASDSAVAGEDRSELVPAAPREPHSLAGSFGYIFDPTRPGSLRARDVANAVLQTAAGRQDPVPTTDESVTEPGSRYIDFLVPGLIGMGLMGGGIWGVGFAIVDLRIRQLLKRLLGTPMRRTHFVLAMLISRILFMIPEILIVLGVSRLLFGVVNHGSWIAVLVVVILGAFEFAALGLLVASRAKTLEAASGLMNLAMVPMWIGSGIFFSSDRFPAVAQPLIQALPLTPLINSLRLIMQDGQGLPEIVPGLLIMLAWTVVSFVLALRWFRWQ
jgi:ABC-type multidrug transport system permease subunit